MEGQTSLAADSGLTETGPCAWCGVTTVGKLVLEKARWGTAANGARELRKPERWAWCCDTHQRSLALRADA